MIREVPDIHCLYLKSCLNVFCICWTVMRAFEAEETVMKICEVEELANFVHGQTLSNIPSFLWFSSYHSNIGKNSLLTPEISSTIWSNCSQFFACTRLVQRECSLRLSSPLTPNNPPILYLLSCPFIDQAGIDPAGDLPRRFSLNLRPLMGVWWSWHPEKLIHSI